MTNSPEAKLELFSAFRTQLVLSPDGDQAHAQLAATFVAHHCDLWPFGNPYATPEWITGHLDEILALVERLYREALCQLTADAFSDRMHWLPDLLQSLDQPAH